MPAQGGAVIAGAVAPGQPTPAAGQPAAVAPATAVAPAAAGPPALAVNQLPSDLADIRGRLAIASQRLNARVDTRWQSYLALPPEIYNPTGSAKPAAIAAAVNRYQAVAADPKYKVLTQHGEFQETFGLLKAYRDLQSVSTIPAPPG